MVLAKDTILYFTGTGNSLQVAKDINSECGGFTLHNVSTLITKEQIHMEGSVLGLIFPVIYARLPFSVERVLERLEINQDTYIFAVATHGGAPAEVLLKLEKKLSDKGNNISAGFLFHMPGNNIFAYGASSDEKQNKLLRREKRKIRMVADIIRNRKEQKCERSKRIIDTVIDRTFIKVTDKIVENLHDRDRNFWVSDDCNGCKLCEKICPVNNILINSHKPTWKHKCEQCTACIQYCPQQAIQWGKKTARRKRYRNPTVNLEELI